MAEDYQLPTDYQKFIHVSRYSRWNDELGRRESWTETVDRYMENVVARFVDDKQTLYSDIRKAIGEAAIMPSMRTLMTAGPALERDNMAGYNCSAIAVDHPRAFDEALYVLSCGTGLGFSVERQFVSQLPVISEEFHDTDTVLVVADSRIGWASSFRQLIAMLYTGQVPKWDVSKVRGKGEKLKIFGGRASGPEPLVELFEYSVRLFKAAAGRKLNSIECHGLMCKVAEVIVVGGVRRSALISLSNLTDQRMRAAKSGQWWDAHPEYRLANNSVAYTEKPDMGIFMEEWKSLYDSKSGERGIFNRDGVKKKIRDTGRRDPEHEFLTNPCGEISLRSAGLCNLTEVIIREDDTLETLSRKVELATTLGTLQSTFTDFRYVRNVWKKNAEEERLLGVSFTGIYDHPILSNADEITEQWLTQLKAVAYETNVVWAAKLGINPSVSIETIKPSGTVSQLTNSASGIHPRHSKYYIRSVRQDNKDPVTEFMKSVGIPNEPDVMKSDSTTVFYFPQKAPSTAKTRDEVRALDHLDLWKMYNDFWSEHQVSVTVNLKEDDWLEAAAWVYRNFDSITGISFLPHDGGSYKQAPYQECTEEQYNEALAKMPVSIDWSKLSEFEKEDATTAMHELACTGGVCEI